MRYRSLVIRDEYFLQKDSNFFPFLKIFSAQKRKILKIHNARFNKILKIYELEVHWQCFSLFKHYFICNQQTHTLNMV